MDAEQKAQPPEPPEVHKTETGQWRCVDCSLFGGRESYPASSPGDMLDHLMKHQQLGEKPPEPEVNQLLREFWEERR